MTDVSNYFEERKIKLFINVFIKILRNLGGNFSNLGSNVFGFLHFFSNVLAFQWATFQHFTSTIGKGLQAGVDATPFWGLITVNGSACTIELWMYLENYYKDWKNPLLAVFLTGMPLILSFLIWAKKNFFASDWTTKYTSMVLSK